MKSVLTLALLATMTITGACTKTGENEYQVETPNVDVDVSRDTQTVRTPDIDVTRDTARVVTPDVDVKRDTQNVTVPKVRVNTP